MEGLTPIDVARGIMIDMRLRRDHGLQGEQASAATTGGGLYGVAEDLGQLGPAAKYNIPSKLWRGWKRGIYTLEHAIEKLPQHGMVGKQMRRDTARQRDSLRGLLKLQKQQLDNYAKGIATDRAMEARIQKATEDVIGRWGKVSPNMRRTLSLAPFAQWLGAATRYVFVTLPVHHPIKTGIIAGISEMTEKERIRLGLSYFAPEADRAPDYQMGMLPMEVGQNKYGPVVEGVRTARMTSLGTAAGAPWNLPEFVLPQVAGAFNAFGGRSFTGEQLRYPDSDPENRRDIPMSLTDRLPVALGAQLESTVPFLSAYRRAVLERGLPAEPYSTILTPSIRKRFDYDTDTWVEPEGGSVLGGLGEWLMPFAPKSRIYTQGAQRDIEQSQQTHEMLRKWNARRELTRPTGDLFDRDDDDVEDRNDLFAEPKRKSVRKDPNDLFE
jgi:hypothetical protein